MNNFGHCHPRVVEAVREQVGRLIHCSNLFYTEPQARLAERLSRARRTEAGSSSATVAPRPTRRRSRSPGSGRVSGEGGPIITLERSFHGRTMATLSATGQPEKQAPFAPVVEGFVHIPLGDVDALRGGLRVRRPWRRSWPSPCWGSRACTRCPTTSCAEAQRSVRGARRPSDHRRGADRSRPVRCAVRLPAVRAGARHRDRGQDLWPAACPWVRLSWPVGPKVFSASATMDRRSAAVRWWQPPRLAVLDLLEEPGLFDRVEVLGRRLEDWLRGLVDAGVGSDVRRLGLMAAVDLRAGGAKTGGCRCARGRYPPERHLGDDRPLPAAPHRHTGGDRPGGRVSPRPAGEGPA